MRKFWLGSRMLGTHSIKVMPIEETTSWRKSWDSEERLQYPSSLTIEGTESSDCWGMLVFVPPVCRFRLSMMALRIGPGVFDDLRQRFDVQSPEDGSGGKFDRVPAVPMSHGDLTDEDRQFQQFHLGAKRFFDRRQRGEGIGGVVKRLANGFGDFPGIEQRSHDLPAIQGKHAYPPIRRAFPGMSGSVRSFARIAGDTTRRGRCVRNGASSR